MPSERASQRLLGSVDFGPAAPRDSAEEQGTQFPMTAVHATDRGELVVHHVVRFVPGPTPSQAPPGVVVLRPQRERLGVLHLYTQPTKAGASRACTRIFAKNSGRISEPITAPGSS